MSDVGDIAALWRRIDAWPDELKQALTLEAKAQSKRDDLRQRLYNRNNGTSADEDEDEDKEDYAPPSKAKAAARRKADRAGVALEEARNDATRRLVESYEARGQRTPAERNVRALVESDADVKAKREACHQAREELEDITDSGVCC